MQYEITYQYSSLLVKKATWQFFLAQTKWSGIISVGILGILGVAGSFSADLRWWGGFLVGVIVFFIFQWVNYFQRAIKSAAELKDNSLVVKFTDDNVTFQSKDHVSITNWPRFSHVWKLKDVWLFFIYTSNVYTIVPSMCINDELTAFLIKKFSENKVNVVRQQDKKK